MTAIAVIKRTEIIEAIASGKRLSDIAPKYGVTPQAISKQLATDPEYVEAIMEGHAARLDDAEYQIECASDSVDVARARALWAARSWRAEREVATRWGIKSEVTHRLPDGPMLQINLSANTTNSIDAVRLDDNQSIEHDKSA